jgi:hypothetical protein
MVPAYGYRLRPFWNHIFLPDVQPGGKAGRVGFLASHYPAVYRIIPMALFVRDVFRLECFGRPRAHSHCDGVHAALSRPFICSPSPNFPPPTNVSIPNILIRSRAIAAMANQIQHSKPHGIVRGDVRSGKGKRGMLHSFSHNLLCTDHETAIGVIFNIPARLLVAPTTPW